MAIIDRAAASPLIPEQTSKVAMGISTKAWSTFSSSDYTDAQAYAKACLINLNTGSASTWTKGNCKLPVYEPGGDLNRNAVHAAAGRLVGAGGGVDAPPAAKKEAAKRLVALYAQLKEAPPQSLATLARA